MIKLFVDMDGVVANWRASSSYEELFERDYFFNLAPESTLIYVLKRIYDEKDGKDIQMFILSKYPEESRFARNDKERWLDKYMPWLPVDRRIFVPDEQSKSKTVISRWNSPLTTDFVLLDDYSENLREWEAAGGKGIKFANGINGTKGTWTSDTVSAATSLIKLPVFLHVTVSAPKPRTVSDYALAWYNACQAGDINPNTDEGFDFESWLKDNRYKLPGKSVQPTFGTILASLPREPGAETHNIWTDGEMILVDTEEKANAIADFIDALNVGDSVTGYFNPAEDLQNNEVDELTGWYYIDI